MPAAQLAHSRSEGKPLSGRVADDSKNGNVGRKLNHEQQMARLRVKFQRAGVRSNRAGALILRRRVRSQASHSASG